MTNNVRYDVLKLQSAVLLLAHGTCNKEEISALYLTRVESEHSEDIALEKLTQALRTGSITATGLLGQKPKLPIRDRWETQQFSGFSKVRTSIPKESWEEVRINNARNDFSEMWVRTPNGQYNSVFLSRIDFEKTFNQKIIYPGEKDPCGDTTYEGAYVPPYIGLMLNAIEHFNISETNQPLLETLIHWFQEQTIEGQKISENEAKKLASFVRLPSSKKGGNRPWNNQSK